MPLCLHLRARAGVSPPVCVRVTISAEPLRVCNCGCNSACETVSTHPPTSLICRQVPRKGGAACVTEQVSALGDPCPCVPTCGTSSGCAVCDPTCVWLCCCPQCFPFFFCPQCFPRGVSASLSVPASFCVPHLDLEGRSMQGSQGA